MALRSNILTFITSLIAIIGILASTYFALKNQDLEINIKKLKQDQEQIVSLNSKKDSEIATASSTINELKLELTNVREDLEKLADNYKNEKNRNEEFEDQIRGLAGTLGELDKLAKTDEELLAKYSKVYFLNENYIPTKLKQINNKYIMEGKGDLYFHANIINHLEKMLEEAEQNGFDLKVISAYRSFDTQTDLKNQYTQIYGNGANAFSADQGFSEHQLGTTIDITVPSVGGTYTSFADTEAYQWLLDNAYKYGFILSYPKGNAFYIYEPWHWRFVGRDLAHDLHKEEKTFYDMDQREINEYLINFFD